MFEKASRLKLRFETSKGNVSVEDLWDLPLQSTRGAANLDDIARGLYKQLKSGDDVSFVVQERKSDETVQMKFDIVKHVIDVRIKENTAAATARANAEKKQKILSIMADREQDTLKNMPMEELRKLLDEMQ